MDKILIIDDEAAICSSLRFALQDDYQVKTTTDPREGLTILKTESYQLVLLDLKLGEYDGLSILEKIKEMDKDIMVIIMTAYGTITTAVKAIKNGAFTYMTKPLNTENLLYHIKQALDYQHLNAEVAYLRQELETKYHYKGMLGKSTEMEKVFRLIDKVKDINTNVLLSGESGTGKELVARAIHYSGKWCKGRFEVVNCAAIPENLLESELFGHKKGAFTGAISDRVGKFELAENGTIFLDEVGEMPLPLQAKLLRVLQQKEITPLGASDSQKLNVRVISATNKDLNHELIEGGFRKDLFYRLNVVQITLPPLRERQQDIPLLVKHFIDKYNSELSAHIEGLTPKAQDFLMHYSYPGNVRELENIIESAMVVAEGNQLDWCHLPEGITNLSMLPGNAYKQIENGDINSLVGMSLEELEKRFIELTLKKNQGHRKKTAQMLGLSEKGLRNKISRYQLNGN